jgi:hypothetical protein
LYELVNCTDSVWNREFEVPYEDENIALVKSLLTEILLKVKNATCD